MVHRDTVRARVEASIRVKQALLAADPLLEAVARAADRIVEALRRGRRVFLFGNGGSAADAQHLAAELVGRFQRDRAALPAEALTVNPSVLTAVANDYDFSQVFSRQVEAHGTPGDVAIGISTSGRSRNVLRGLQAARQRGLIAIALTGADGGPMRDVADLCLCVPSTETPRIQECHILIGHILCELAETALYPPLERGAAPKAAPAKAPAPPRPRSVRTAR
jgi:D-sedoheptulose 7-phosphate isomerase